jgi:hypothetical protein
MGTTVRVRSIIGLTLLAALLLTGMPRTTAAASGKPSISSSTYQSGQWCDDDGGEKVCAIRSHGTFSLLQISGKNFTKNGPAVVTVTNLLNFTTVSSGAAIANSSGKFLFKTQDVEVCANGTPLLVQVYDLLKQTYSNSVFVTACQF